MGKRTAVVTMVYNEPVFLPLWRRYYGPQFGEDCCYVIDHGTDDGSTEMLGEVNVVRIPRSPKHNKKRANFISNFCSALLEWYDAVIYVDIDEFLIPDPEQYASLKAFVDEVKEGSTITAIGIDISHVPDIEPPLDLSAPILGQRRWTRFAFPMCKPLVTTVPIRWTPGFHSSDQDLHFDRLFLFHLHNFDLPCGLSRLAITRSMPWGDGPADHYQRWSDEKHEEVRRAVGRLSRITGSSFRDDDPIIGPRLEWIRNFFSENPEKRHLFYFNNGITSNELIELPVRFHGLI